MIIDEFLAWAESTLKSVRRLLGPMCITVDCQIDGFSPHRQVNFFFHHFDRGDRLDFHDSETETEEAFERKRAFFEEPAFASRLARWAAARLIDARLAYTPERQRKVWEDHAELQAALAKSNGKIVTLPNEASTSKHWTGKGDGRTISDPANWDGGVPGTGDRVYFLNPTQEQLDAVKTKYSTASLRVNPDGSYTRIDGPTHSVEELAQELAQDLARSLNADWLKPNPDKSELAAGELLLRHGLPVKWPEGVAGPPFVVLRPIMDYRIGEQTQSAVQLMNPEE